MSFDSVVFVGAFRPVFLSIVALPLPIGLGLAAAIAGKRIYRLVEHAFAVGLGSQISLLGALLLLLVIAVSAFSSLSLRQYFVVHLRQTGLAARTKLGRLSFVPFGEIERAKPVRLLLLRFLRIEASERKTVYIPLFIERKADFDAALATIVDDEEHPLRKAT